MPCLFAVILLMSTVSAGNAQSQEVHIRQGSAQRVPDLDGRVFTSGMLFDTFARSQRGCAQRCLGFEGCMTFTFMTSSSTCRGYTCTPSAQGLNSLSPGAETWSYTSRTAQDSPRRSENLVFRMLAGIGESALDVYHAVNQSNDETSAGSFPCSHFRSRVLDCLPAPFIDTIRLSVYKDGDEAAFVDFNGANATYLSWFSSTRVLNSSWADLESAQTAFEIDGRVNRHFYIPYTDQTGCDNIKGWLIVRDVSAGTCEKWEDKPPYPVILYSKGESLVSWNSGTDVGMADELRLTVKTINDVDLYGSCFP